MTVTLHHGDCLDVMREMPDASVDAIVTDPPYGLGFMGKKWDALPPGEEWARECLRVLKPGGHLLAFGGTRTWHRLAVAIEDAGFEIRDSIAWMHGQGFPKGKANLKPAHEPIVVARKKPDEPRTGLLQIDAARIDTNGEAVQASASGGVPFGAGNYQLGDGWRASTTAGRWPANVALDESQAAALDEQSGVTRSPRPYDDDGNARGSMFGLGGVSHGAEFADSGGASRFFYVAKASKAERPVSEVAHPTVKPLKLMRWLVRLVTPPGGTVLEPFAGSGTTVEACLLEGFNCVAIEREADYLPLIQQRIDRCGVLSETA